MRFVAAASPNGAAPNDDMVRYLVLFSTPEDTEAFDRHYREGHIPLVKALPGLRRYVVGHPPHQFAVSRTTWSPRRSGTT